MTFREAMKIVVEDEALGDSVYDVRESASGGGSAEDKAWWDANPNGNSWDHPRVVRFSEAVTVLENWLKENPE